tara:strand:+ start:58583 stop:60346 length:1764 start_codon:yes stop_codon:yes gene_type:complete
MLNEQLDKLKTLIESDWNKEVMVETKRLLETVKSEIYKQEEEHLRLFVANKDNDPNDYSPEENENKELFSALASLYGAKKKEYAEAVATEERNNLTKKENLIQKLETLVKEEENIKVAFDTFKAIDEEFKTIGRVPGNNHQDITNRYHTIRDRFFYNIRIYQDLKELDLKKNLEIKKGIIDTIGKVVSTVDAKDADKEMKALIAKWYETGPVPKEVYEELKAEFQKACDEVYTHIKAYFEIKKKENEKVVEEKQGLIDSVKSILAEARNNEKDWQKNTKEILDIQAKWKTLPFGTRAKSEELWNELRALCNSFFDDKKVFYQDIHQEQDKNKLRKLELIEKADAIKDTTDWAEGTKELKYIQNQWKKIGRARQRDEQKLWVKFRAICDHFFNTKDEFFKKKDADLEQNLDVKLAIIEEIKSAEALDNKEASIKAIKSLITKYNAAGYLPKNKRESVTKAYDTAIETYFEKAGLSKAEVEQSKFVAKIQGLLKDQNADDLIKNEVRFLRDKISEQEKTLAKYETNLSFFSGNLNSPLVKEATAKVDGIKNIIDKIKAQIKLINKLRKEATSAVEVVAQEASTETESND